MRRAVATVVLVAGLLASGAVNAQASPWVPDIPTGPCPYAGCDDLDDIRDQLQQ